MLFPQQRLCTSRPATPSRTFRRRWMQPNTVEHLEAEAEVDACHPCATRLEAAWSCRSASTSSHSPGVQQAGVAVVARSCRRAPGAVAQAALRSGVACWRRHRRRRAQIQQPRRA
ncbi:unnamed protein product [Urochloa humidicola]